MTITKHTTNNKFSHRLSEKSIFKVLTFKQANYCGTSFELKRPVYKPGSVIFITDFFVFYHIVAIFPPSSSFFSL